MVRHMSQLSIRWLNVVSLTQHPTRQHTSRTTRTTAFMGRSSFTSDSMPYGVSSESEEPSNHAYESLSDNLIGIDDTVALTLSLLRIRKFINSSTANILQTLRTEPCTSHFHFRLVFKFVMVWLFRLLNSKCWVLPIVLL